MYSLVYATVESNVKLPKVNFVITFRNKKDAIDACYKYANTWANFGENAQQIYVSGTELCIATAYTDSLEHNVVLYSTLTVVNSIPYPNR